MRKDSVFFWKVAFVEKAQKPVGTCMYMYVALFQINDAKLTFYFDVY